jgi:hypothetical protein
MAENFTKGLPFVYRAKEIGQVTRIAGPVCSQMVLWFYPLQKGLVRLSLVGFPQIISDYPGLLRLISQERKLRRRHTRDTGRDGA